MPIGRKDRHQDVQSNMAAWVTRRSLYKPALALVATSAIPAVSAEVTAANVTGDIEGRVRALAPQLEDYVTGGMAAFYVPGAAVGVIAGDRLVYAKGFGERCKNRGEPVGPGTVFQIGSTTKAIGAALMAIAVDRGKLKWDDRVVDLYPTFALKDPWVTREFRVYDLMAQRSGLPSYANDALFVLGFDADWMIRSLRFVEPTTSFRGAFTYTNITHLIAERILVTALGAADWRELATREILEPLGMRDSSFTAEAIERAADHAVGHRWTPRGSTRSRSVRCFRTGRAPPATSTRRSRIARNGYGCNSEAENSPGDAWCRPQIWQPRAPPRSRSTN